MEYFSAAKTVRLRSSSHKYLVAGDDRETVKQSRHGTTRKARWTVEIVNHGGGGGCAARNIIRLRSCHGTYLAASDDPFLLGVTGKKAVQIVPATEADVSVEWEPVREGFQVKLRSRKGKFLRANKGPPPYNGSVTVDDPTKKATKKWILWGVDILQTNPDLEKRNNKLDIACSSDISEISGAGTQRLSASSSSSSLLTDDPHEEEDDEDDVSSVCSESVIGNEIYRAMPSSSTRSWMELFGNAKTVRLRSRHDKYLFADDDLDAVSQDRHGGSRRARWTVEYVKAGDGVQLVRLRSCYDKYLTATDEPFLLGVTGKKVKQRIPRRLDSSVEWEPIRDGMQVKFKTRYGNFLRANGGLPPWRNSVTHDVPSRSHTLDWILWEIEVLENYPAEENKMAMVVEEDADERKGVEEDDGADPEPFMPEWMKSTHRTESITRLSESAVKNEGRAVLYNVVDDEGDVANEGSPLTLNFKGHGLEELKQVLEEETGLEGIILCSRNPLNGKLNPLRLALPPQHVKMHVFVVPPSSQAVRDLGGATS